jgi:autotransporter strand-loop-strand O-heptosyltransferase
MITYKIHHVNGLYFELTGDENKNREYDVVFYDNVTKENVYDAKLKIGCWARAERKYLSDISVIVRYEGRTIKQINFLDEIKGKRVFITFESKALGDTLAWMPYCAEFAKHYDCKVVVSTFKNFLFEKEYPELEFVDRGVVVSDLIGMFEIGWYWQKSKEPVNPILIPLQQSATNILHLPYKELQPKIDLSFVKERPFEEKYVCISIHSTAMLKYWYYWQELIDGLKERGYKVVEISKETNMMGIDTGDLVGLEPFEDKSLENTMNTIYHCDFFVGLSSGLSWMSWALRKKVFMIANFTEPNHEFNIDTVRIYDHSVCNSCWHNPLFKFNKGDWRWCPEHEDTPRHFECHKAITSDKVLKLIDNEISKL